LLDRGTEQARIDDLLEVVRQGMSDVLVLRGSDGVGKTTLVDYAVREAAGFHISAIAGVESEINLPYCAVHQLLIPFLQLINDLPDPQRQALQVAFGQLEGSPLEPFLVGLACLTLLSRAAADQPVLCAVDDAHWIDTESALVLGFVARRLYADRLGMVLTMPETGEPLVFHQLPTAEVSGLPYDAAADSLRSVTATPLEPALVDRVVADTERNPLALVDIGSHYAAEELAARAYLPGPMPTGRHVQQRYLRLVHRLPPEVQEFALLVAADVSSDRWRVRRAAAAAGMDADATESAAEAAELIEASGGQVRFLHPLIRAAVYHGASDADRRRAHYWLSQASITHGDECDADNLVWHRAAAAAEPDEHLAADLEAAAGRARHRGAWSATATLLRSSVALTPDPGIRAPREVALARARAAGLAQVRESTARGQGAAVLMGKSIVAIAELHAGHCEAAVDAALPVIKEDPPLMAERTLPALVEAAVRSDHTELAHSAFATLADRTKAAGTPWAHGLRARCRALLEDGSNAEASFLEAISQLGRSHATPDLAHGHLLYGQWLRRAKRRRDARRQLRVAEDIFDAMGAAGFAEQARSELRATGERARRRVPETEVDLTPQEARIAHLAAGGSTNSEIAEHLFISPSTVDYHLGKVFRKVGVRSRTQLARRLPTPA
jgi:DNA-binding CsgD family transcriptional regulator